MTIYKTEYFIVIKNINDVVRNVVLKYFKKDPKHNGDYNLQTESLYNTHVYIGLDTAEAPGPGRYLSCFVSPMVKMPSEREKIDLYQFLEEVFRLKRGINERSKD